MRNPKNILITGASSGIGEALAIHYAAPDVFLALSGRNEERLLAVAEVCKKKGAMTDLAVLDVTDQGAMQEWIIDVDSVHMLDLVIANAGISGGTGGVMTGEPVSQARQIFETNLTGVLNTVSPVLPRMIVRQKGQIALISSMAGFRGFPSAPAYCASKGAVRIYGEALRGSLVKTGVAINVVCPGFVKSRMTDANDFYMPFLMPTDKAAWIIADRLSKNVGRIAFPWPIRLFIWFISLLPDVLIQRALCAFPSKGQTKN